jgi:hypothetical protein
MKFEFKSSFGPRISYEPHVYLDDDRLYIGRGIVNVWIRLQDSEGVEHDVDICPSNDHGVYLSHATWDDIYRDIEEHLEEHRDVVKAEYTILWGHRYPFAD